VIAFPIPASISPPKKIFKTALKQDKNRKKIEIRKQKMRLTDAKDFGKISFRPTRRKK
jgi:hypothetical protein